ncbi:MAG: cytochrome c [Chloroflexi bacterium]|nr:cytochrome c [Ardenticatenaceae bacterium]NOG35612.1 cytochrome c [Chloroflexota bacterium]
MFSQNCGSCHSTIPETVIVGPSLAGIASRAETRKPGQDGRTYLYTAILQPGDFLVDGYSDLMPATFGKQLTGEDLDAVVAYLLTLE